MRPAKIARIDHSFLRRLQRSTRFERLWVSHHDFAKHLKKRLRHGDISSAQEYFEKTKQAALEPSLIYAVPSRRVHLLYIGHGWVDVVSEDGRLITSFPLEEPVAKLLQKEPQAFAIEPRALRTGFDTPPPKGGGFPLP